MAKSKIAKGVQKISDGVADGYKKNRNRCC